MTCRMKNRMMKIISILIESFVNLPVRSVKMGRAKMGVRSGVLLTFERCTW